MRELILNLIISFIVIWIAIEFFLNYANRISVYESGISHKNFMVSLRVLSFILFLVTLLFIYVNLHIFNTSINFICSL